MAMDVEELIRRLQEAAPGSQLEVLDSDGELCGVDHVTFDPNPADENAVVTVLVLEP